MSFDNRKVENDTCRAKSDQNLLNQEPSDSNNNNMMWEASTEEIDSNCGHNVFQGSDFDRFLSGSALTGYGGDASSDVDTFSLSSRDAFLTKDDRFLSKDDVLPNFDADVFNSREAFSGLLKDGWDIDIKFTPVNSSDVSITPPSSPPMKTFPTETASATELDVDRNNVLSSRDWVPYGDLGSRLNNKVPYDALFKNVSESDATPVTSPKFDWETDFYTQLKNGFLPPPPSPPSFEVPESNVEEEEVVPAPEADVEMRDVVEEEEPASPNQDVSSKAPAKKPKKKRKRKPRQKILPAVYEYVGEPRENDILCGRGGKTNHHPGNKRWLEEVKNLQGWYRGIEADKEKTDLSQCLVDYVQSYGGRFIEKDSTGWFIIPNRKARLKAGQALRENNDPEIRKAKRARYLEKKASEDTKKKGGEGKTNQG